MYFKFLILSNFLIIRFQKRIYRNKIKRLQHKKWKNFQKTLLLSPFYKKLVLNKIAFEHFPLMNKSLFMENFNTINTQNIDLNEAFDIALQAERSRDFSDKIGEVTVGLSSGTSGNRGVFLATEKERAQWVAAVMDRVLGFTLKKRSVAFFLRANSNLYSSVKSNVLDFQFFDLFDSIESHIERLNELKPNLIVAQPSMLLELADAFLEGKLKISPQKIISVAEVLYPEDKKKLAKVFNQVIHQVYQCTEGFLASSCSEGNLHFNEDFLIIEKNYLDDSKERFHPVITDLLRESQPVVRYELNDIIIEKTNCSCGQKTLAIKQIEGRSDDVLVFKNDENKDVTIFPDFFRRAIIMADEDIIDYMLVQYSRLEIKLYVSGSKEIYEKAKSGVEELLKKYKISDVNINRSIESLHEKGNKLRRIRNEQN